MLRAFRPSSLFKGSGPGRRLSRGRFLPLPIMKELPGIVQGNTYLEFCGGRSCYWNGMSKSSVVEISDFRVGAAASSVFY